ncbi:glycosyltransferase family 2 protein [Psychroserpens sp. XS_ASV72]|uniref:glycosyltransferase family 2 protein n=1 Tax=Psychroserpens sp. XS_ASV72 TaxID=3241293 RepID=UPI0035158655
MKFSVITSSFNSDKTITRTLDSLLNQTLTDFEYIVIDGASTDNTVQILKAYEAKFKSKNISFKWISEKDSGIYDAWNKGLKLASGDWISFLGSDDYYLEDALETYDKLSENTSADWMYSNVLYVESEDNKRLLDTVWTWKGFRRNIVITPAHVGSFHSKAYFDAYGNYDTSYKIAGDYELLLRAKQKLRTLKSDKTTAVMSGGGVSNNMVKKALLETARAKHQTGGLSKFICNYDYLYLMVKFKIKSIIKGLKTLRVFKFKEKV